jgi:NAD(P)-dependent dehydrogenase (short-subunit alcohol dehydrogenase family)
VLVTGAGRGIGRAIARGFAAEGAEVILVGRTREALDAVAAEIGSAADAVACDVSSEGDVDGLAKYVAARYGWLHVLVNCAALRMHHVGDPSAFRKVLADVPPREWDAILGTNLRGPYLLCRALAGLLRAAGGASVINVSAGAATSAEGGRAPYAASKAALEALTRSLAAEWRDLGIRVNTLVPDQRVLTEGHHVELRAPEERARYVAPEALVPPALYLTTSGVTGERIEALVWNEANGFGGWERWEARPTG